MTAQHQYLVAEPHHWFQPIHLPAVPYLRYVRDLNVSLAELEKREGVRVPISQERHFQGAPRKAK